MGILNIFSRKQAEPEAIEYRSNNPILGSINISLWGNSNSAAMKSGVVYRCVNLISDSIASLPLIPYNYLNN
jgi:phage portal protein BeeE